MTSMPYPICVRGPRLGRRLLLSRPPEGGTSQYDRRLACIGPPPRLSYRRLPARASATPYLCEALPVLPRRGSLLPLAEEPLSTARAGRVFPCVCPHSPH